MTLCRCLFLAPLLFVVGWSVDLVVAQQTSSELHVGELTSPVALADLSKPLYPPLARQAAITGIVDVVVTVDGSGAVKSVQVVSGPALLKDAAVQSASHSRFACETCGQNSATYRMQYTFNLTKGESCSCSDQVAPPVASSEQEGDAKQFQPQAQVVATAQQFCICHDSAELSTKVRSPKCLYLWRCRTRQ